MDMKNAPNLWPQNGWYEFVLLYHGRCLLGLWQEKAVSLELPMPPMVGTPRASEAQPCMPQEQKFPRLGPWSRGNAYLGSLVWDCPDARWHSGAVLGQGLTISWLEVPTLGLHHSVQCSPRTRLVCPTRSTVLLRASLNEESQSLPT